MKRRTAILGMLAAIPGLGFLGRRNVIGVCCCKNYERGEIIPFDAPGLDAICFHAGRWIELPVGRKIVLFDEQDMIDDRFGKTVWIDLREPTSSRGFLNGKVVCVSPLIK